MIWLDTLYGICQMGAAIMAPRPERYSRSKASYRALAITKMGALYGQCEGISQRAMR